MKKTLALATSAMILTACSNAQSQAEMPTVGSETDSRLLTKCGTVLFLFEKSLCTSV